MRYSCDLFGPWDPGKSHHAQVEVTPEAFLFVLEDGRRLEIPAEEVRLSRGGFDDLAIVVEGAAKTGEALHGQVREEGFLTALVADGPGTVREQAFRLERSGNQTRRMIFLAEWGFTIVLIALILGVWFGFSHLSGRAAEYVPVSVEGGLGELTAQSLIGEKKEIKGGPVYEAVKTVWDRLLPAVSATPYQYRLYVIESGMVNALAAPGGHVVVFTGLLATVESAEELAGILAHEIMHVENRHGIRRLLKSAGVSVVLGLVFGDMGGLGELFKSFGGDLLNLSYSREDEKEADLGAVRLLTKADIDPREFPEFFRRMAKESGSWTKALTIISSHPHGSDRDAYLQKAFSGLASASYRPIPVDWPKLITGMKASLPSTALPEPKN